MSRTVPFYISLPVILSCGAAGYIVGSADPGSTSIREAQSRLNVDISHAPTTTPKVSNPAEHDQEQAKSTWVPPSDGLPVVHLQSAARAKPPTPGVESLDRTATPKVSEPAGHD